MSLADEIRNIKSSKKELRAFGLSVGGVLIAAAVVLYLFGRGNFVYFAAAGIALAASGALVPAILLPLQKVWMSFAVIMGWCSTRVIIILLFVLVLTPIGLISRAFGKEFLDTGFDQSRKSYWRHRETAGKKSDYERQF
ncbi:MAG: hypothetical protein A2052_08365 [Deltaproteobacteria bacterium GWA2_54_12]|nr:MAG: hypothetical protein A2052_08365 [Deltaproteobacteria bacterium GWA2_54_12]